jgi:coenzyme F420 hydrogenase subunit beta
MSAKPPVEILIETVVETGLCTRCGTCTGACPTGNITIDDPTGDCLPTAGDNCTLCWKCLNGCPGASVTFRAIEKRLFGDSQSDTHHGVVRRAYLAHATDQQLRGSGASGGVVTALLLNLLRQSAIDGALLYGLHEEKPWFGQGRIIENEEGIRRAAQSRYHLSPMNTALRELTEREGTFAYAGLPCHVHGLRKLEDAGWTTNATIDPVIGIYCGNNLYFEATRVMLEKLGVGNLEDVTALSYREGEWPGSFAVKTTDGRERSISKHEFNQAIPFYINKRCLLCIDLANELTDISVGDGWEREGSGEGGWSVILERTERGAEIIAAARENGMLHCEEIGAQRLEMMHAHALDLKKTGAGLRLGLWKSWGLAVPEYDRTAPSVSFGRRVAEWFISLQFMICSSGPGRFAFKRMPVRALGRFFRRLRSSWMARSRHARRNDPSQ